MGLFDLFKKKESEPEYDPTNLKITDLKKGFLVDYEMDSWIVKEEYEYDWGNHYFTREFQLDNGKELIYLYVDDNEELELSVSRKVKIRAINEDLPEEIINNERPPKKIVYEDVKYLLDEESAGYFRDVADGDGDDAWSELISWEYYDKSEKLILNVEQWGEREFEASIGKSVEAYEFSNILPGS
ncbi:DUF4178 domain-containing protein [Fulvivirgaceae bacterium BMA10]|uniref:DUF4178 domain-containing protein n=1 Tax=Splendidivirga corallicola TaxID=3051826 RepID=A0ABT8KHC3_9BACT|nr:DUF4178 domain-containing protein [Fulvivirgaceae bacterium BMA10]